MDHVHRIKAWPFIKAGVASLRYEWVRNLMVMAGFFAVTLALSWGVYAYTPTELSQSLHAVLFSFLTLMSYLPLFVYGNEPEVERPKYPIYFRYLARKEAWVVLALQLSVIVGVGLLFSAVEGWVQSHPKSLGFARSFENVVHILVGTCVIQLIAHLTHRHPLPLKSFFNHFSYIFSASLIIFVVFFGAPFLASRLFVSAIHMGFIDLRAYGHMGACLVTSVIICVFAYWSLCGVVASRRLYHHLAQLVRRET